MANEEQTPDAEVLEKSSGTGVVDDDGHTLEDITPWDIDEDDDDETAQNGAEDDPGEYLNWDRDEFGPMSDYATEAEEDEPVCCSADDDDDVEVGA